MSALLLSFSVHLCFCCWVLMKPEASLLALRPTVLSPLFCWETTYKVWEDVAEVLPLASLCTPTCPPAAVLLGGSR